MSSDRAKKTVAPRVFRVQACGFGSSPWPPGHGLTKLPVLAWLQDIHRGRVLATSPIRLSPWRTGLPP
jgi:hypothetical protein